MYDYHVWLYEDGRLKSRAANLRWLVELVVLFSPILPIVKANLGVNRYTPLLVMYPNVSPLWSIMVDYKSVFSLVNPMKSPCSREDLAGPGKGAMGTMGAMEIWAATKAQWHHDGQLTDITAETLDGYFR